jgi:hypothetical protein
MLKGLNPLHRVTEIYFSRNNQQNVPCIRIYYTTVHWRLNMFRAAYRTSSGALTVFAASGLRTHVVTVRKQVWVGIYYSTVHWRLNMFRTAYRSSSGTPTVFAALGLHTHVVTGCSQVWVGTQTWLRPVSTCVRKPQAANTVGTPDDERYASRNMLSLLWTVE